MISIKDVWSIQHGCQGRGADTDVKRTRQNFHSASPFSTFKRGFFSRKIYCRPNQNTTVSNSVIRIHSHFAAAVVVVFQVPTRSAAGRKRGAGAALSRNDRRARRKAVNLPRGGVNEIEQEAGRSIAYPDRLTCGITRRAGGGSENLYTPLIQPPILYPLLIEREVRSPGALT